jgi:hypothetical protein
VNEFKTLFDRSFDKIVWEINPSIIPFLTPINICEKGSKIQVSMAPINHNQLNQSKATQIAHTILGNAYKSEDDSSLANQDFGNNACVLVGCNNSMEGRESNKVTMRNLHPNTDTDSKHTVWRYLFPTDMKRFRDLI